MAGAGCGEEALCSPAPPGTRLCDSPKPAAPRLPPKGQGREETDPPPTPLGCELSELRSPWMPACPFSDAQEIVEQLLFFFNSELSSQLFDFPGWGSQCGEVGNACTSLPLYSALLPSGLHSPVSASNYPK